MRKTKEETEITRQRLLKAALDVFSQKGYSDTRLEDIADQAEVTRGAIYHHFNNKAELYTVLVSEASAKLAAVLQDAITAGGTTLEVLRRIFVDTLVFAARDDEQRAISELIMFKTSVTPELEGGLQMKREGNRVMVEMVTQMVAQGMSNGEIRHNIAPQSVALGMLALQNGLLALWLMNPDLFSLGDRAGEIADLYISGITA